MAKKIRPFNPAALPTSALTEIRAAIGTGAVVWRYPVLLPMDETQSGKKSRRVATLKDHGRPLELILSAHFNGVTVFPPVVGQGLRQGDLETNTNVPYVVYAAAVRASEDYFRALKEELQDALAQETILIERQEVWVL
jgi:hypothetical protein